MRRRTRRTWIDKLLGGFVGILFLIALVISAVTGDHHSAAKFVTDTYFAVVTPIATFDAENKIKKVEKVSDVGFSLIKLFTN